MFGITDVHMHAFFCIYEISSLISVLIDTQTIAVCSLMISCKFSLNVLVLTMTITVLIPNVDISMM